MTIDISALERSAQPEGDFPVSADVDELMLAALERGGELLETGRYLVTFREGGQEEGLRELRAGQLGIADTRDFESQAMSLQEAGGADVVNFSEINVALLSGTGFRQMGFGESIRSLESGAIETIEPEYFVFADSAEYLRGFARAAGVIAADLAGKAPSEGEEGEPEAEVLGFTWGLAACRASASRYSGARIKMAILDTGLDLGHPDFTGRPITHQTFVGQPVQDLNGHGTHCTGTACGRLAPPGSTPRYGIAHQASIHIGKVLSNSGSGSGASVLAGINWAIAKRCEVISMSLGSQSPVQLAYTNAGNAALNNGLLIVAAAGNESSNTGAPANSPSILSVASLDPNLSPSSFSNFGKVEIAAPGRDIFSSWPRPRIYRTISGTSMATPHVAGCAALWAQSNSSLRGMNLWRKLQASARRLPFPPPRVGTGLVIAP